MKTQAIIKTLVWLIFGALSVAAQNSISGIVFDANRRPIAKIDVELLDEFERLMRTTATNGSGLYLFQGLRAGNYYVQVRTDGTSFAAVKERVQLGQSNRVNSTTGNLSGLENVQINFMLAPARRPDGGTANEVVFAQNVPREAEQLYQTALKKLAGKQSSAAVADLEAALEIYPEYFLALDRLGYEYLAAGRYAEAENAFAKAFETNAKSFSAASGLGIARFKLQKRDDAARALEKAIELNPSSANSHLFLGRIYRELKDFGRAETSFKRAAELGGRRFADAHWELALLYYHNLDRAAAAADELELYLKAKPKAENRAQVEKLIADLRGKAKNRD